MAKILTETGVGFVFIKFTTKTISITKHGDFSMKCIRYKKTETVTRVSDSIAANEVAQGFAEYVPKHIWKKEIRDTIQQDTPTEKPKRRHNKKTGKQKMIEGNK